MRIDVISSLVEKIKDAQKEVVQKEELKNEKLGKSQTFKENGQGLKHSREEFGSRIWRK